MITMCILVLMMCCVFRCLSIQIDKQGQIETGQAETKFDSIASLERNQFARGLEVVAHFKETARNRTCPHASCLVSAMATAIELELSPQSVSAQTRELAPWTRVPHVCTG